MIEKLGLPFPILSDPDRAGAIRPYGVADEKDARDISHPAIFVVSPDAEIVYSSVSTDFADRVAEAEAIEALEALGLEPTLPESITIGPAEPGPKAMPISAMVPYYRGAKFAGVAMRTRHPEIADDLTLYIDQMDRYTELARRLGIDRSE